MEHLKREKADALYKEATLIANTFASDLYNNETTMESVQDQLDALEPKWNMHWRYVMRFSTYGSRLRSTR